MFLRGTSTWQSGASNGQADGGWWQRTLEGFRLALCVGPANPLRQTRGVAHVVVFSWQAHSSSCRSRVLEQPAEARDISAGLNQIHLELKGFRGGDPLAHRCVNLEGL